MAVDYTKLLDGNSLKAIRTYLSTNYQPLHANLTSIAALSTSTTGLIKMTNGVASFDTTTYAPAASPTFTGTVTLPTTVKIGTSTATGLVKYTNGVLSIDTTSYVKANNAIAGATKCKITYDAKGLVTAGDNLAASDIPDLSATYVTLTGDQNITGTKTFINQIKFKTSANSTNEQLTISLIDVGSGIGYSKLLFDGCSYLEFRNMQLSLSILSLGTLMGNYQTVHGSSIECLWLGNSEGGGLNLISPYNSDGAISFRTNNSDSGITQYKLKVPSTVGYTEDRTIATTADIPTSLPASDVYAWAKAATKPSYNLDEVTDGSTRKLDNYLSKSGGTMGGNITLGSGASGQTQVGASLVMGIQNDSYGLLPYSDNWNQIGADGRRWYRAYISNIYGTTIYENGTSLVNKYLGKSDQAADSAKLGGVAASSYATQSWAQGLMTPTAVGQGQTKSNVNGYNGATFTIGTSGYNGIYIFTYGNCFVFLPIYGITANTEYKIAASLVNSAGSYTCKVLTYRYVSSSGTLQIYQKENYIPTGYGCALFKVKLY